MMNKKSLIVVSLMCSALLVSLGALAFNFRTTPSALGVVPQPVSLGLAILQRANLSREAYLEAAVNVMTNVFAPNGFIPYPGQNVSEADSFLDVFVTNANATVVELDRLIRDTIIAPEALDIALRLHDILADSLNAIINDSTKSIETEPPLLMRVKDPPELALSNITDIPYEGSWALGQPIKIDISGLIGREPFQDNKGFRYLVGAWRDNDRDGYLGVGDEIMVKRNVTAFAPVYAEWLGALWATIKEDIAAVFEPPEPVKIVLYCATDDPVVFDFKEYVVYAGIPPKYTRPIVVVYQIPIRCLNWPGFDPQVRQPEVDQKEGVVTKRWESFVVVQKVRGMKLFRAWYRWPDPIHGPLWLCGAAWLPAEYISTTIVTPGMTPTVEIIEQVYAIPELGEFIWFFKKDP